jgi:hypothetical protein
MWKSSVMMVSSCRFLDLSVIELGHTPPVVEFTQAFQPPRAVRLEPFADLSGGDAQTPGNLLGRFPLVEPQQGTQATPDAHVSLCLPQLLNLLPLDGAQLQGHRSRLATGQSYPRNPFLL